MGNHRRCGAAVRTSTTQRTRAELLNRFELQAIEKRLFAGSMLSPAAEIASPLVANALIADAAKSACAGILGIDEQGAEAARGIALPRTPIVWDIDREQPTGSATSGRHSTQSQDDISRARHDPFPSSLSRKSARNSMKASSIRAVPLKGTGVTPHSPRKSHSVNAFTDLESLLNSAELRPLQEPKIPSGQMRAQAVEEDFAANNVASPETKTSHVTISTPSYWGGDVDVNVSWGDGSPDEQVTVGTDTHQVELGHAYPDDGSYEGTATFYGVGDEENPDVMRGFGMIVDNIAPSPRIEGNASALPGTPYTINLAHEIDPGPDTITKWVIDWGDGSNPDGGAPGQDYPANAVSATHTYAVGGNFTISGSITDEDGTYTTTGFNAHLPFGGKGHVSYISQDERGSVASAIAVQTDGKILVAGADQNGAYPVLQRYQADGTADTFVDHTNIYDDPRTPDLAADADYQAVAVGPGGSIYVAGNSTGDYGQQMFVSRFQSDGATDTAYGDQGHSHNFESPYNVSAMIVQSDGRAVVAGSGGTSFNIVRLNSGGGVEMSGSVSIGTNAYATSMVRDSEGRFLIAGRAGGNFAVARFLEDGTPDPAFGVNGSGFATVDIGGNDSAEGIALLPDGGILVAGSRDTNYIALAKLQATGAVDTSFGTLGKITRLGFNATAMKLMPNGKILVAGFETATNRAIIARFTSSGAIDNTYAASGIFRIDPDMMTSVSAMDLDAQGRTILAGSLNNRFTTAIVPGETSVSISNIAVTGSTKGVAGGWYLLNLTSAGVPLSSLTWTIDWGDGTGAGNGETVAGHPTSATHTYAAAGTYAITATATDGNTTYAAASAPTVVVSPAPAATNLISGPAGNTVGTPYTLNFNVPSQAGTWTVDWGDGNLPQTVSSTSTSLNHNYAQGPSSYLITATHSGLTNPLDTTFGASHTGKVQSDLGTVDDYPVDVEIQEDGKIVVAGGPNFAVARYNTDGTPDTTFGASNTGSVVESGTDAAWAVSVLPDGKILVGGGQNFALAQFESDGTLDTTFGTGGKASSGFGVTYLAYDMAVLPDGKILLVGKNANDLVLARFNSDGSKDTNFGVASSGKINSDFLGSLDKGWALTVQPDGKILVAGEARNGTVNYDWVIARYYADGSALDSSFGSGGKTTLGFGGNEDTAWSIAVQPDGNDFKILVGGQASTTTGNSTTYDFAIARYNSNGTIDGNFGLSSGYTRTDFGVGGDRAYGLKIQPDGKYLLVGRAQGSSNAMNFGVARYQTNGAPDTSFGSNGRITTDFNGSTDHGEAAVIRPDGSLIVIGAVQTAVGSNANDFGMARYHTTSSAQLVVSVAALNHSVVGAAEVDEGSEYRLDLNSDPNQPATGWSINWGDNSTPTTATATDKFVTHTYTQAGRTSAIITATVTDSAGPHVLPVVNVQILPAFPSNIDYTFISTTQATITWTDRSNNEIGYTIQQAADAAFTQNLSTSNWNANSTQAFIGGIAQASYYVRVGIRRSGTDTVFDTSSLFITFPPNVTTAPGAPVLSTKSNSQIGLTWTDSYAGKVAYKIERSTDNFVTAPILVATTNKGATSFTDSDLSEGTRYWYRLRANNTLSDSPASATANAYTYSTAPGNLLANTQSASTIALQWDDNSQGETGYLVERALSADGPWTTVTTTASGATTASATLLAANTTYFFRVSAVNGAGTSPESATASEKTDPAGLLASVVSDLDVDRSNLPFEINLNWSAADNADGYTIQRKVGIEGTWQDYGTADTTPTFYSSDLLADSTYFFRVIPFNAFGVSEPSNEVAVTVSLQTPSDGVAVATPDGNVSLTWSDNSPNETGFRIWRRLEGTDNRELIEEIPFHPGTGTAGHVLSELNLGEEYTFEIQAITPDMSSGFGDGGIATPLVQNITATGPTEIDYGAEYDLDLSKENISDSLTWTVDWGDGSEPEVVTDGVTPVPHTYVQPDDQETRSFIIQVSATNAAGDVHYQASAIEVTASVAGGGGEFAVRSSASASITAAVSAVALSPRQTRLRILRSFNDIYNTIKYEPYIGFKKGNLATAETKSANDWDQAALLKARIESLNMQQPVTVQYMLQVVQAPAAKVAQWLGVKDEFAAEDLLGLAGVLAGGSSGNWTFVDPTNRPGPVLNGTIAFWHVWLRVTGSGIGTWDLDPSWKYRELRTAVPAIGTTAASRFDGAEFHSQTSRQNPLEWYETKVTNYIRSQTDLRGKTSLADIPYAGAIIGKNFVAAAGANFNTAPNPFSEYTPQTTQAAVGSFSQTYDHRVQISLHPMNGTTEGAAVWTSSVLSLAAVGTDPVTVRYVDSGVNYVAELWQGNTRLAFANVPKSNGTVRLKLNVYRAANTAVAASRNFDRSNGDPLALMLKGDQFSPAAINRLQASLNLKANLALADGSVSSAEALPYQYDLLSLVAAKYAYQYTRQQEAVMGLTGMMRAPTRLEYGLVTGVNDSSPTLDTHLTSPIFFYSGGRGVGVDLPGLSAEFVPISAGAGDIPAALLAVGYTSSYLESSVLEETINTESVSTAKGFQWAKATGGQIVTGITTQAQLQTLYNGIATADKTTFNSVLKFLADDIIDTGSVTIATNQGNVTYLDTDQKKYTLDVPNKLISIAEWKGSVWIQNTAVEGKPVGWIISNGVTAAGGSNTNFFDLTPTFPTLTQSNFPIFGGDPVQLFNGALYHDQDVVALPTPGLPLTFSLHYDTQYKLDEINNGPITVSKYDRGLGMGWTHTYSDFLEVQSNKISWTTWKGQHYDFTKVAGSTTYKNPAGLFGVLQSIDNPNWQYQYRETDGTVYRFEKTGRLQSILDRNGNQIVITYYGTSILPKVVQYNSRDLLIAPRKITFQITGNQITSISDDTARTWTVGYHTIAGRKYLKNANLDLVNSDKGLFAVDSEDMTYTYFDADQRKGLLKQIEHKIATKPAGTQKYDYYANGRAFSTTDAAGSTEYFSYNQFISQTIGTVGGKGVDLATASTTHIDYNGNSQTTVFNDQGLVARTINPDRSRSDQSWFHYGAAASLDDEKWLVRSSTDEVGLSEFFWYDTGANFNGKVKRHVADSSDNPATTNIERDTNNGVVTTYKYDPNYGGITETLVEGVRKTSYTYENGNLKTVTDAEGKTTTYDYLVRGGRKSGLISAKTMPRNSTGIVSKTTYDYDAYGQLDKENQLTSGTAVVADYDYTTRGNLLKFTDGGGKIVFHDYDVFNRERELRLGTGQDMKTTYTYGTFDNGNGTFSLSRTTQTQKHGNTTVTVGNPGTKTLEIYDGLGRLAVSKVNDNASTSISYDGNGNAIITTDPMGNQTQAFFDSRNRQRQTLAADGGFSRTMFDGAGRMVQASEPVNTVVDYRLDPASVMTNAYNTEGRLETSIDPVGQKTTFTYNQYGDLTSRSFYAAGNINTHEVLYNVIIDNLGRVREQRDDHGTVMRTDYDANGNANRATNYDVTGVRFFWNPSKVNLDALVTSSLAANNDIRRITSTRFDSLDRSVATRNELGSISRTYYDGAGRVVATVTPNGFTTSNGQPLSLATFEAAATNLDALDTVANDYKGKMDYDTAGRIFFRSLPDLDNNMANNFSEGWLYYGDGRLHTYTNARGKGTTYKYENINDPANPTLGSRTTVTNADATATNRRSSTTYDLDGRVASVTDEKNHTTTYEYDSLGRKTKQTLPDPATAGQLHSAPVMVYTYDQAGNLVESADATATISSNSKRGRTTHQYDEMGREIYTATFDANSGVKLTDHYSYYLANELIGQKDGRGILTFIKHEYPTTDLADKSLYGRSRVTTGLANSFNTTGGKLNIIGELDISKKTFNAFGSLIYDTEFTDAANSHTTIFEYDRLNRLSKTTEQDPDGTGPKKPSSTYQLYDRNDNLIASIDPTGAPFKEAGTYSDAVLQSGHLYTTTYAYDAENRKTAMTLPDPDNKGSTNGSKPAPVTNYTYDANSNLQTVTDSGNYNDGSNHRNVTTYVYDDLDRVQSVTTKGFLTTGNPTANVSTQYEYDDVGNVEKIIDRNGRVRKFQVDALDRTVLETWFPNNSTATPTNSIRTRYDQHGKEVLSDTGDNGSNDYSANYDALGRTTLYVDANGVGLSQFYDANSNRIQVDTLFKSKTDRNTLYSYDLLDNLNAALELTPVSRKGAVFIHNYQSQLTQTLRFNNFNITINGDNYTFSLIPNTQMPLGTENFKYDNAGYLKAITNQSDAEQYGLERDEKHRIKQLRITGKANRDFQYDADNQLTNAPGKAYTYDDNFNRTEVAANTAIGADNRLKEDSTFRYEYDGEGNLTNKYRKSDGVLIARYTYDNRNRLTQVLISGKTIDFTYDASDRRSSKKVNGTLIESYTYDGDNLTMVLNGGSILSRYLYGEAADQIVAEDTAGAARWYMTDHQGSVRKVLDQNGNSARNLDYNEFGIITTDTGSGASTRHKYTCQIHDAETGLDYYGARFYDASLGKFINQDPAREGNNYYSYVGNNPLNMTDPTGLNAFSSGGGSVASQTPSAAFSLGPNQTWGGAVLDPVVVGGGLWGSSQTSWGNFVARYDFNNLFSTGVTAGGGPGSPGLKASGALGTDYIPASRNWFGASGQAVDGAGKARTLFYIDVNEYGGPVVENAQVRSSYAGEVARGNIAPNRFRAWEAIQEVSPRNDTAAGTRLGKLGFPTTGEREVMLSNRVEPSAVRTPGSVWLQRTGYVGSKTLLFFGLKNSGEKIINGYEQTLISGSPDPLVNATIDEAAGWGGAWALGKLGAGVGFMVAGPVGSAIGGIGGGILGYAGGSRATKAFAAGSTWAHQNLHAPVGSMAFNVPKMQQDMHLYSQKQLNSMVSSGNPAAIKAYLETTFGTNSKEARMLDRYVQQVNDWHAPLVVPQPSQRLVDIVNNAQQQKK
jgi:RHS repeat-associated protein/uncharacterized delta-60 repeat protein